jgi:hypothetical protein
MKQRGQHPRQSFAVAGEEGGEAGGRDGQARIAVGAGQQGVGWRSEAHVGAEGGELVGLEGVGAAVATDDREGEHQVALPLAMDQAGGVAKLVGGDQVTHLGVDRGECPIRIPCRNNMGVIRAGMFQRSRRSMQAAFPPIWKGD